MAGGRDGAVETTPRGFRRRGGRVLGGAEVRGRRINGVRLAGQEEERGHVTDVVGPVGGSVCQWEGSLWGYGLASGFSG